MSEDNQPIEQENIENEPSETLENTDVEGDEGEVSYSFGDEKPAEEVEIEQEVETAPQWEIGRASCRERV